MTQNKYITEQLEKFDEKYFDKNTPSGLNQKDFADFPSLVKDIRLTFLTQSNHRVIEKFKEMVEELELSSVDDRLLGKSDEYLEGYYASTERWRAKRDNILSLIEQK